MNGTDEIIRLDSTCRLSRVIRHANTIYFSGITGTDGGTTIEAQTQRVLAKLDDYLARCETDKTRLLSVQIWLRDIERDFNGLNQVWDAWTPVGAAPTRAAGQSWLADPAVLVEIIATATLA